MTSISIVFATHNGAATLPRVLEGYRALTSSADWKLIVIDNRSNDATPAILSSFQNSLPMTVLAAPVPGKNRALNMGVEAAGGDLVVFTDDDSIPSPGFVDSWRSVALTTPGAALFGGLVEPVFDTAPPPWILTDARWSPMLLVTRDLPEGETKSDQIFGPNMAVRRSVLDAGLRFDERIGPNSADPLYPMGSETDFLFRGQLSGANSWFSRKPHVRHIIRARQLRPRYWAQRAYRSGKGRAFMLATHPAVPGNPAVELKLADRLTGWKEWWETLSTRGARRFRKTCNYHYLRGLRDGWALYGNPASARSRGNFSP